MKISQSIIQKLIIIFTITIMAVLIWGVSSRLFLNYDETQQKIIDGMINKEKK